VEPLFHITTRIAWNRAQATREYRPESLLSEGFIHLSTEAQWRHTLYRFYRYEPDLVVLQIDPAKLGAELRFELADGEPFPHLFGPLETTAVVAVRDAPRVRVLPDAFVARVIAADDAIAEVVVCDVTDRGRPTTYGVLCPKRGREGQISLAAAKAAAPELGDAGWMQLHSLPRLPDGTLDEVALLAYVETIVADD
jgi:uncharacterized protein (DUF952 family)